MERDGALLLTRGQSGCRFSPESRVAGTRWRGFSAGDRLYACRLPYDRRRIRSGAALVSISGRPIAGISHALGSDHFGLKVRKKSPPIRGAFQDPADPFVKFALFGTVVDNCFSSHGYDRYPLSMMAPWVANWNCGPNSTLRCLPQRAPKGRLIGSGGSGGR